MSKEKSESFVKAFFPRQSGTCFCIFRIDEEGEITKVSIIKEEGKEFEYEVKKNYSMQTTQYKQLLSATRQEFENAMKKATEYFSKS